MRFVSPFLGGGGSVELNKTPSAIGEIWSDIDADIITLWKIVKNQNKDLVNWLNKLQYDELTFKNHKFILDGVLSGNELTTAAAVFVKYRMSRGGLGNELSTTKRIRRGMQEHLSAWQTAISNISTVNNVISRNSIQFRCGDFESLLVCEFARADNLLVYCDPPYFHSTRNHHCKTKGCYKYEMTDADHVRLLNICNSAPSNVFIVISGYANDVYNDLLKNWNRVDKTVKNNAGQNKKKNVRIESVWKNF